MAPQITIDITDVQLKAIDDSNDAANATAAPGDPKSSRETFAAAAITAALQPSAKASKKANPKD